MKSQSLIRPSTENQISILDLWCWIFIDQLTKLMLLTSVLWGVGSQSEIVTLWSLCQSETCHMWLVASQCKLSGVHTLVLFLMVVQYMIGERAPGKRYVLGSELHEFSISDTFCPSNVAWSAVNTRTSWISCYIYVTLYLACRKQDNSCLQLVPCIYY